MGQKVNPIGLRLGINKTWSSTWFAKKNYSDLLHKDLKIREFIEREFFKAGISEIVIERAAKTASITIYAAKPGIIIGKKGVDIEALKKKLFLINKYEVQLNVVEVKKIDINAVLVAQSIGNQLERRVAFRRAMKRAMQSCLRSDGAYGIRVNCSGRLSGAEIARMEWYREGRVPLHTLKANIDYGEYTARTTAGAIGVKVWIYKGDVVKSPKQIKDQPAGNI